MAGVLSHHGLPGFAAPGLLKLRHVLHHAIDPVFSRRVGIRDYPDARLLGTHFLTPYPPESQEEALLGSVTVDLLTLLPGLVIGDHALERHQGNAGATIVGCVLAQRETPVQLEVVDSDEARVLVRHATGPLLEFLAVLLRPPIVQIALRIKLTPLVVEAVGEFVTDDQANSAEVHAVVHFVVKKWRLQDARRKHDFVVGRVVVRVYRWWSHAPFLAVERFVD